MISLGQIEAISKNARSTWIAILVVCAYSLLTLATVTDAQVVLDTSGFKLPVVGAEISVRTFLWAAPLLILILHLYNLLYLQRLWRALATQPACDSDQVMLPDRIYPWMIGDILFLHVDGLKKLRPPLAKSSAIAAIGLGWGLVPVTLTLFWIRTLRFRDLDFAAWHILSVVIAVFFSVFGYEIARQTLRSQSASRQMSGGILSILGRGLVWGSGLALCVGAVFSLLSFAIFRDVSPVKNWQVVSLRDAELSERPKGWFPLDRRHADYRNAIRILGTLRSAESGPLPLPSDPREFRRLSRSLELKLESEWRAKAVQVIPARLQNMDLRNAQLISTFAVRSNFANTNLSGAHIAGAALDFAQLNGTLFRNASIRQTQFVEASMVRADLTDASLESDNFERARMIGAILVDARILGGNFGGTILSGADLSHAKFLNPRNEFERGIIGATRVDLRTARFGTMKMLWNGREIDVPTILAGVDLSNVLVTPEQLKGACGDEDTKLPTGITSIRNCRDVVGVWPLPSLKPDAFGGLLEESARSDH